MVGKTWISLAQDRCKWRAKEETYGPLQWDQDTEYDDDIQEGWITKTCLTITEIKFVVAVENPLITCIFVIFTTSNKLCHTNKPLQYIVKPSNANRNLYRFGHTSRLTQEPREQFSLIRHEVALN